MRPSRKPTAGFTLVELLIALTIGSLVLVSAVTSLGMLTEAANRTSGEASLGIEVRRALRLLEIDLRHAASISVSGDRFVLTRVDGTGLVYERTPTGEQLHRVDGSDPAAAEAAADAIGISTIKASTRTARGHLADADYYESAVVQGAKSIAWDPVLDITGSSTIGLKVSIAIVAESGTRALESIAVLASATAPSD